MKLEEDKLKKEQEEAVGNKKAADYLFQTTISDMKNLDEDMNNLQEKKLKLEDRLYKLIAIQQMRIKIYSVLEEKLVHISIIDKRDRWLATLNLYCPKDPEFFTTTKQEEKDEN